MEKETAITVKEGASALSNQLSKRLTKEQKELIKRCFAKNATDDELDLYYNFCEKAEVDPLRGQSHFIKYNKNDKPIMMIGIDGFQARAVSDSRYEGMTVNAVYEHDEFSMNPVMGEITHSFGVKDRGKVAGAYAILQRKGMPIAVIWVNFKEYDQGRNLWTTKKDVMICKVAKASLLRREYPDSFSGVYIPEEFGAEITDHGDFIDHAKDVTPKTKAKSKSKPKKDDAVRQCLGCGGAIPMDSETGKCAKCITAEDAVQDAEFEEVPDEEPSEPEPEPEDPDEKDEMLEFVKKLKAEKTVTAKMTPREGFYAVLDAGFPDYMVPCNELTVEFCANYRTDNLKRFQIPESACKAIVKRATGKNLKLVEKSSECKKGSCSNKVTEPEAEEHDDLCQEHWQESK
ncbi:MAG: RecT family recombinase [Candidatus Thorarchaeota archaeon]